MVFPTYREHGVAWCRGIDPVKLLELYRGVSHGGWAPEEHKFHLYTIVIGSQTLHATGYAMTTPRRPVLATLCPPEPDPTVGPVPSAPPRPRCAIAVSSRVCWSSW